MTRKPIPEFEVTMAVRNNRLKARRRALGLTQKEIAKRLRISVPTYIGYETLRLSPLMKNGEWRRPALRIANFFGESPWEIFPDSVLRFTESATPSTVSRQLNASEIGLVGPGEVMAALPPSPHEAAETAELRDDVARVLKTLSSREQMIVRLRFGMDEPAMTYDEIGERVGVTHTRIAQIIAKALRILRHPSRTRVLRPHEEAPDPDIRFHVEEKEYGTGQWVWVERGGEYSLGRIIKQVFYVPPRDPYGWLPQAEVFFRVRLVGKGTVEIRSSQMSPAVGLEDAIE